MRLAARHASHVWQGRRLLTPRVMMLLRRRRRLGPGGRGLPPRMLLRRRRLVAPRLLLLRPGRGGCGGADGKGALLVHLPAA